MVGGVDIHHLSQYSNDEGMIGMANKLKLERFVANEIKVIQEILQGKEIPQYYSVKDITKKLFKYYVEEEQIQINEAIENICHFLDDRSILYSKKEINGLKEWYDPKKVIPLRRSVEPLVFTKTDQEILMSLGKREEQRLLFSFMLIAKFQRLYTQMSEPNKVFYDLNAVGKMVGMNANAVKRSIKELGLCGFVLAPLEQNCMIVNVNCLSDDSDIVLEVQNFEPDLKLINKMFIQLVGETEQKQISLMCIPLDDEEDVLYFNSINEAKRELNIKGESDICRAYKLDRCHAREYMFFQTKEEDTKEFLNFVTYYYRNNIAPNYRRMKKSGELNGVKIIWCNPNIIRDIYNRFMEVVKE